MKRSVFILILTAGFLSLLLGIILPAIVVSYRNKLHRAEEELRTSQRRAEILELDPAGNFSIPGLTTRQSYRYRLAVASAQDLLSRDVYRAEGILTDIDQCPPELHDFSWHWAMGQMPRVDRVLFDGNCHQAVLSADGNMLAVMTGEWPRPGIPQEPHRIRVIDLRAGNRSIYTLLNPSADFALSPNGQLLAVRDVDEKKVLLCDVTRPDLQPIQLADAGTTLGFTADGSKLLSASGGQNGHLTRWNAKTGAEVNQTADIEGDKLWLTADGSTLVSLTYAADAPGRIRRYETATGEVKETVATALNSPQMAFALSPDGASLATVGGIGAEQRLAIWDLHNGKSRWSIQLPTYGFDKLAKNLAFSPDGKTLATNGSNDDVRLCLWDVQTGAYREWFSHEESGGPEYLLWQPDGSGIVLDTLAGPTRWKRGTPAEDLVWKTPEAAGDVRTLSADGHLLAATTTTDGSVKLWDVVGRRVIGALPAGPSKVIGLHFADNGKEMAMVHEDHAITVVDTATAKVQAKVVAQENGFDQVLFHAGGLSLTTLDTKGTIRIWDCANGEQIGKDGVIANGALSTDGRRVVHLDKEGKTVIVTDAQTQAEVASFNDDHKFETVGFLAGPDVVIAFDEDGGFSTWDVTTNARLHSATASSPVPARGRRRREIASVHHYSASGDGKVLAILTDPGQVQIVDSQTGEIRMTASTLALRKLGPIQPGGNRLPEAPTGNEIDRFSLSKDGRLLVIVGREAPGQRLFCQILDCLTGDEVRPVPMAAGPIQDAMFSADGSTFVVAKPKGPITLWKLP